MGSLPESPEYTGVPTDEALVETGQTKIDWKGPLNLTSINPIKLYSNESFNPVSLQSIPCVVTTIKEIADGFKIHEVRPKQNIWLQKKVNKIHIVSGPIGVALQCKVEMITNIRRDRRSLQKAILHLSEIKNAVTEFGEELPELSKNRLHVIAETANTPNLQTIEKRVAKIYLKPKAPFSTQYNQTSDLVESIARFWPQQQRQELPLSTAKILTIIHDRNGRKTNKAAANTTNTHTSGIIYDSYIETHRIPTLGIFSHLENYCIILKLFLAWL